MATRRGCATGLKVVRKGRALEVRGHVRGGESAFWHAVKKALRCKGQDVIKKEMVKDGHMVSEHVFYVRSRKVNAPRAIMVWDPNYAIRNVAKDLRESGSVTVRVERARAR